MEDGLNTLLEQLELVLLEARTRPDVTIRLCHQEDKDWHREIAQLTVDSSDTIVPIWGYRPVPSARGFTLCLQDAGATIGTITMGLAPAGRDWLGLVLDTIFVDAGHRGSGKARLLEEAAAAIFTEAIKRTADLDQDILLRLDPLPSGDFNDEGLISAEWIGRIVEEALDRVLDDSPDVPSDPQP